CLEDAVEILMGIREKLEAHHGIKITDEAVFNAVFLSHQYITDKNLPDKAIDLVDEASSALKLSAEAMPVQLAELQGLIRAKKIYAQVEKHAPEMKSELEKLEKEFEVGKALWESEVLSMKQVSELKNQLDRTKFELEQAERNGDYDSAGKLKYSVLPELEEKLSTTGRGWTLETRDVAAVISRQTGIPIEKILKDQQNEILKLEEHLNARVFGQKEALKEISETLITSHAGLKDQSKPLGSFLLKGPSGVGKTETAKALAEFLFNDEDNIIRLDMSEYSEKHSVAKLIGAPAGYVGYEEGGVLTEAVRRKPYAVILFDEIEKAHQDFSDILLQILDDGRLTDNRGRTINFKNTVILLTTNSKELELEFKPEVLGRIDSILNYLPLDSGIMKSLVDKELSQLNLRLQDKKITLGLSDNLSQVLCKRGYDPRYGARPLATVFNKLVIRPLSKKVLEGQLESGNFNLNWQENENRVALEAAKIQ
ncbi:MAG: AAA domain-containing protein, partial [Halobacteriovoraceae bacterium]|nr:AAA domain-containing protein [Halobacteriovoraceae bacterium]